MKLLRFSLSLLVTCDGATWFLLRVEISASEGAVRSLAYSKQSLSVRASELESTERRVNERLEELELVSWKDKLDLETSRCSQLDAEAQDFMSSIACCEGETDRWQRRLDKVRCTTETLQSNRRQLDADKSRLKQQVDIN